MEKRFVTADGTKEVKLGDTMHLTESKKTEYGTYKLEELITVSPESIPYLLKKGAIVIKESKENAVNADLILSKIANHLGIENDEALAFLDTVYYVNIQAFLNIVYKKVAIELDKQFPDHISKANDVWVISTLNGHICKLPICARKDINFKTFSAFRTFEGAKLALEIGKELIKRMDAE